MIDTATTPETTGISWTVIFRADGTLGILPTPSRDTPSAEWASAEWVAMFANLPRTPSGDLVGAMAMSRPDGPSLSLYPSADGAATSAQLAALKPFLLSRWSARIVRFGDIRFEEGCGYFDLGPLEPAIVRYGPAVGRQLAATCVGRPVFYSVRDDGLRTGGHPDEPIAWSLVGWVDDAVADGLGIVASLAIIRADLHHDLASLDAAGDLESARLCLWQSATATRHRTGWAASVFDVTAATATKLVFTSLSHALGTHLVRRLGLDEPLSARDFRATDPALHVPRDVAVVEEPTKPAEECAITPGSISPVKRTPLLTMSQTVLVPAGQSSQTVTHNLNLIPHITVDTTDTAIVGWPVNITTTQATIALYNLGSSVTRTIIGYAW